MDGSLNLHACDHDIGNQRYGRSEDISEVVKTKRGDTIRDSEPFWRFSTHENRHVPLSIHNLCFRHTTEPGLKRGDTLHLI